jgi:D-alanyl-D-alanine carboxypeptidase/D-alanyl-D-alanine-endopeptidase (penicillin-binding protein 4)
MRAAARRPSRPFVSRKHRRARTLFRRVAASIVVIVGAIATTIALVVLLNHHRPTAIQSLPASPAAPVLPFSSAFISSGAAWSAADTKVLVGATSPIVNSPDFPPSAGAVFLDARTGRTLYEHNASMALVPASTIKLIVAAAALHYLGADYRFETKIAAGGPMQDGVLQGNLYLVGGGDPVLTSHDLRAAAHQLHDGGITGITGNVIADGSLYGADSVNPTWDPNDIEYGWAAPPSALTLDNGAVQFTIKPDPNGGLAGVVVDPDMAAGRLVVGVRTVGEGDENTLRIDPLPDGSGFAISGQIPYGAPQKYWRSIAHPTEIAASVLRSSLARSGVAIVGETESGQAPADPAPLWSHRSVPLDSIIRKMAFDSDNHIAEQLLRAVGAKTSGQGTLHNGIAAERAFLKSLQVNDGQLTLADGCGLSPANKITAASLVAVLRSMLRGADAATQAALLPRLGIDGTVRSRVLPDDASGRVLGKDGYIEGATGLAGFVKTAHHGIVIYAFLVNDWQLGLDAVWNDENEILTRISRL